MANIKSQIKRNKQNQAARLRNRVYRGSARTYIRKLRLPSALKTANWLKPGLKAIRALDKAASRVLFTRTSRPQKIPLDGTLQRY